jgi:hypothetical protein
MPYDRSEICPIFSPKVGIILGFLSMNDEKVEQIADFDMPNKKVDKRVPS